MSADFWTTLPPTVQAIFVGGPPRPAGPGPGAAQVGQANLSQVGQVANLSHVERANLSQVGQVANCPT
jgi:hypothetical protein